MRFEDLGLDPKILKALDEAGYTEPTPIQAAAIPDALQGKDVLGIAQTGTGKTASFTLPMIHRLAKGRAKARMPRSLVLAPTRELAAQVAESFEKYGKYHKLSMALLIGGVSFGDQDAKLSRGVDVLVATPGRLLDHYERGKLLLTGVQLMVVDEADRMLDMGFIPDIEKIFNLTPFTRQTLFFSATMPDEIQRITNQFLSAPSRVEVAKPATTAKTITQQVVNVPTKDERQKRNALRKLVSEESVKNGIIFCNRKRTVDIVASSLQKHGHNARPIHGDLAQSFRMETLDGFRNGSITLLVASDVAARGLDIPDVSHVFNFDIPIHADDYVHRIGRTGRAGKKGHAITLLSPADKKAYENVLSTIGMEEIDAIDMGDFFEQEENKPAQARSRSERGRSERGRGDKKRPSRKPSETADTDDALEETPKTESKSDKPPRRAKRDVEKKPRNNGADNDGPRKSYHDLEENTVVGLGDHVPAFLNRVSE